MIRPERLTVKAAEALQQASGLARERGNPVVNDAHLFHALLSQDDGIVVPLLQKAGLNVTRLKAETERELDRFPKQSGSAAEPTLSREVTRVLDRADEEARGLGDAYVSTEHLLLGLIEERLEEHTSELQSLTNLVCRLLLEKKTTQEDRMPGVAVFVRPNTIRSHYS